MKRNKSEKLDFLIPLVLSLFAFYTQTALPVGTPSPHKCQEAIKTLGSDLKNVKLSKQKTEQIFTMLLDARRKCANGHQGAALNSIARARTAAGLKDSIGEFDWENIPLDSLEGSN